MYAKIALKEMIGDGLHGGEPVNLPFSICIHLAHMEYKAQSLL